jgi:hypothetical protein
MQRRFAVYAILKRGGLHAIVEGERAKIEEDAKAADVRGTLAKQLLAVHDSEIGAKLAALEAKFIASVL